MSPSLITHLQKYAVNVSNSQPSKLRISKETAFWQRNGGQPVALVCAAAQIEQKSPCPHQDQHLQRMTNKCEKRNGDEREKQLHFQR